MYTVIDRNVGTACQLTWLSSTNTGTTEERVITECSLVLKACFSRLAKHHRYNSSTESLSQLHNIIEPFKGDERQ